MHTYTKGFFIVDLRFSLTGCPVFWFARSGNPTRRTVLSWPNGGHGHGPIPVAKETVEPRLF